MVGWTRFRKTSNSRVFINKIYYFGGPRQARSGDSKWILLSLNYAISGRLPMIGWMQSFAFLLSGLLSLAGRITRACSSFLARWRMCGEVVG